MSQNHNVKLRISYKSAYRLLIFTAFIGFNSLLQGQVFQLPGTPLVKNFTTEEINQNLQIFDISQNKSGEMYFATPAGLLEYDGIRWKNYTSGTESDLRTVLYVDDQHIYTGGHGGFGYWSKNNKGVLTITTLFFKHPEKDDPLLPVFTEIHELNGKILFQTFQEIYIYDPVSEGLDKITAIKGFNALMSSKGRVFIQDSGVGLCEIKDNKLLLIDGSDKEKLEIIDVFVRPDDELLIITKNDGIWSWKEGVMSKNNWEINAFIEKHLVNDAQELDDNRLALGTIRKGIYVISSEGNIVLHQEKNKGLLENTISRLYGDLNGNLWIGSERGLSYLQISSNTTYLLDNEGEFGTIFTSHLKDTTLYLGTSQGLFVKSIYQPNSEIELIDESIGQIWKIEEIDNQVLVGSHEGVSIIENNKLKSIHKEGGGWIFRKHPEIDDILYVGFYSGVGIFKKINENWVFIKKWENFGESSRFMEFDNYGQLWVAHPTKGYYRLVLSKDGMDLEKFEFYGVGNTFVQPLAYISKIDNNLIFYNPAGFFNYDPIDNTFIAQKYASQLFKGINDINSISQDGDVFWYSTPKSIGYILRHGSQFVKVQKPFYAIRSKHHNDFNKFEKLKDSIFAIGINGGVVFHRIDATDLDSEKIPPTIRSIELISKKDTILAPIEQNNKLDVPHGNNFIKVRIALPKTPLGYSNKVQYKLKGLKNEWSNLDYVSELNFPGLSQGSYELEIRSGDENGDLSQTVSKSFIVRAPWYLSTMAFIIYALVLILINILYRAYFKRKNKKQIERLKEMEAEKRQREKEKFKLEKLEIDKEVLTLKEENLNLEIKKKNNELASSTLNNLKKNELLTDLIEDIERIDKNVLNSSLHSPIKKVLKKINTHLVDKDDWLTFELHFRNAHSDFFDKLREEHPDLSSNEIKLSAYLKLNLSSKEIASLLNISIKSVEQGRWRLRKKLDLPKDSSLVNYIQSF